MVLQYEEWETTRGEAPPSLGPTVPPPIPIRKMPVRIKRVNLSGDFEGWWADVRTNAPFGVYLDMLDMLGGGEGAEEGTRVARAMGELINALPGLVRGWNFVDTEGEPLPCTLAGMRQLPQDLLMALLTAMNEAPRVPKP